MNICLRCGAGVDAKFCAECGHPSPTPPAPTAHPPKRKRLADISPVLLLASVLMVVGVGALFAHSAVDSIRHSSLFASPAGANHNVPRVPEAPASYTIKGDFTVEGGPFANDDVPCPSDPYAVAMKCLNRNIRRLKGVMNGKTYPYPDGPGGGYGDIRNGTEITVLDAQGTVLAAGQLTHGELSGVGAVFSFVISEVPKESLYQVRVADRGSVTYSFHQLEDSSWTISPALG
jgi:hypothetical protein